VHVACALVGAPAGRLAIHGVAAQRGASVAAIIATALVAAAPASASRARCSTAAHGRTVIAENARGLAYVRGARVFACSYASGTTRAVPGQGRENVVSNGQAIPGIWNVERRSAHMAGRHIAYWLHWTETTDRQVRHPIERGRVISFDFGARKITYATKKRGSARVVALVVKANGSVAWIDDIDYPENMQHRVAKMDSATGGAETALDADYRTCDPAICHQIDPGSLALSSDRTHIYWNTHSSGNGAGPVYAELR
jgi:hypothetical protein